MGSIPVRVTKNENLLLPQEVFIFVDFYGIERATPVRTLVQKHASGMFLARGRFHFVSERSRYGYEMKQIHSRRQLLIFVDSRTGHHDAQKRT